MTDILEKDFYTIQKGDKLVIANSHFPYPPFCWYRYKVPDKVIQKRINTTGYIPGEGGSFYYVETLTFPETGIYSVKIEKMEYGTGQEIVEKTMDKMIIVI